MKTSLNTLEGLKRSLEVELPIDAFIKKPTRFCKILPSKLVLTGLGKGKFLQKFYVNVLAQTLNQMPQTKLLLKLCLKR